MSVAVTFDLPPPGFVLGWAFAGDLFITAGHKGSLSDERLDEYQAAIESREFSCVLGIAIGAIGVTSVQRKRIAQLLKGKKIIVITDSAISRGIMTALGWLGLDIKSFNVTEFELAAEQFDLPNLPASEILKVATTLKDQCHPDYVQRAAM
ncbi:MAG: hypothetical protein AAF799_20135 [Myxococcota bacterium]